jgi:4-cresol dehydrogenase (hydroxylating)
MQGVPTDHALKSTYWRKRFAPPADMDPDQDGCGLLWCSPVTPADGEQTLELTRLASTVLLRHGFEPAISLTMIADRSLACVISIAYDRSLPGEDRKAAACYDDLLDQLRANGFHSYRLTVRSMEHVKSNAAYDRFVSSLKNAVDPNGILSPGRYDTAR